jgi:UDP-2-acetamido-2,6-beta-L-arabino-hexul-4-ose reductase
MMNILVTGARGFVGKNLCVALHGRAETRVYEYDVENPADDLRIALKEADIIFHLAGVNRPQNESEFRTGNVELTRHLCTSLRTLQRAPRIIFTSSIQAELDNPYGRSKREAEEILREFVEQGGGACVVHRLKNLYGKWCRPNYNAVTATFCYNSAHDLPLNISDPGRMMDLTYIDDVVEAFLGEIERHDPGFRYAAPLPSEQVSLGELADLVSSFRQMRTSLILPDLSRPFVRRLYATYLSYLEKTDLAYSLAVKSDARGSLAEFIKSPTGGQIFISRTHPGITRGNHHHQTKVEKFLVLEGEALIRLRSILGDEIIEIAVRGEEYRVVDIPPGYTHSIQNTGTNELVTLFWANEVFNPQTPDTTFEDVKKAG